MTELTAEQLRHAYEAGVSAWHNARGLDDCPLFAMGDMGSKWRAQWVRGWHDTDAANGYLRSPKPKAEAEAPGPKQMIRSGRRSGR